MRARCSRRFGFRGDPCRAADARRPGARRDPALAPRAHGAFHRQADRAAEDLRRQAAIAIDNVRLFNETKEALEQQTAISEILRVISSSPTDVQPVLDAIAERAARLCDAAAASMYLIDGDVLRHLASKGPSPDPVSSVDALPINRDSISGRALLDGTDHPGARHAGRGVRVPAEPRDRGALRPPHGRRDAALPRGPAVRDDPAAPRRRCGRSPTGKSACCGPSATRPRSRSRTCACSTRRRKRSSSRRRSAEVLAAISSSIADTTPVLERDPDERARGCAAGKDSCRSTWSATPLGIVHLGAHPRPTRMAAPDRVVFPVMPLDESSAPALRSSTDPSCTIPTSRRRPTYPRRRDRRRQTHGHQRSDAGRADAPRGQGRSGSIVVWREDVRPVLATRTSRC